MGRARLSAFLTPALYRWRLAARGSRVHWPAEEIGDPSAGRIVTAKRQDADGDWNPNEGAKKTPKERPEEDREQYERRRYREHRAGNARLDIAADNELDDVEANEDAKNRLPRGELRRASKVGKRVTMKGPMKGM
jgi:hypothetical protein